VPIRVILGLAAGLLALGGLAYVLPIVLPPRPPSTLSPIEEEVVVRRLVLESNLIDAEARAEVLRRTLKDKGERCDSVTMALMTRPGRWSVECAPTSRYRVAFDENGQAVSAVRVR
jgi:hypothetical protein